MRIGEAEVAAVREAAERERSVDRRYEVDLVDASGEACARVEKVEHVRRRRPEDGPG